jgi:hypothetical protein
LTSTGIIDGVSFRKEDFTVVFKAVNFTELESDLNPAHGVVRYEFVETIVRVAIEKFLVKGTAQTEAEAVKRLLMEILDPNFEKFDGNVWRVTRYFSENMEIVFKTYLPVF